MLSAVGIFDEMLAAYAYSYVNENLVFSTTLVLYVERLWRSGQHSSDPVPHLRRLVRRLAKEEMAVVDRHLMTFFTAIQALMVRLSIEYSSNAEWLLAYDSSIVLVAYCTIRVIKCLSTFGG